MPMHDWTRVSAGTFHDFHNSWITHIKEFLNEGFLPDPYYAMGEQRAGDLGPDILTLKSSEGLEESGGDSAGGAAVLTQAPPQVRVSQEAEEIEFHLQRQRTIAIRHSSGDRIVALIEIVSRANRHSLQTLHDFADKVVASLRDGIHVLIVDPFPPSRHDPDGIHGFIWERMLAGEYSAPADEPLTLVSYCAKNPLTAWIEPLAVGAKLTAMPLFLTSQQHLPVPLEETYARAWKGVPQRWKRVIEDAA